MGETPGPIPNPEAKTHSADGTAPGRVWESRTRNRVYVMEQGITTVEELDGRDLEPTTQVWWIQIEGVPVSTLRVLKEDPHTLSIGRVATDKSFRGHGLASALHTRRDELIIQINSSLCMPRRISKTGTGLWTGACR